MDAKKLEKSIADWEKASNNDFQTSLGSLYKDLLAAIQTTEKTPQTQMDAQKTSLTQNIKSFLGDQSEHMDTCVRWHLLHLVISSKQHGDEASDARVQLATMIMESDKAGEVLLFDSLHRLNKSCLRKSDGDKQEAQKNNLKDAPRTSTRPTGPHLDDTKKKTYLFKVALEQNFSGLGSLLAVVKRLLVRNKSDTKIDDLVRGVRVVRAGRTVRYNIEDLHLLICDKKHDAASILQQVLRVVPGFLKPGDTKLSFRIIENANLSLAKVLLTSEPHRTLLTTQDCIVRAIVRWVRPVKSKDTSKDTSDDSSDDDDDDDNQGRELVKMIMVCAPENVLLSPELLKVLMQNNLLEEKDILDAYTSNDCLRETLDDQKDPSTGRHTIKTNLLVGPTSSSKLVSFTNYVENVDGILNMAVLYQQQPLVEALLRKKPQLAVIRNVISIKGGTFPPRKKPNTKSKLSSTGHSMKEDPSEKGTVANNIVTDKDVDSGHYPLWFNNQNRDTDSNYYKKDLDLKTWTKIRSALIYCTMKHADNVQTLLTILRDSKEPEREISFDMSRLLIEGTSVADFVASLPRDARSLNLIRYEETIRYAEFPSLDRSTIPQAPATQNQQHSHRQHTHTEVQDILEWLELHGVRRIITLRVPDRMAHPHDERVIADVVRRFRVEKLDWRILDLSPIIFRPHGGVENIPLVCDADDKPKNDKKTAQPTSLAQPTYLTHLHLYTGGRQSALCHLFGVDGLQSTQLTNVYIHVIKELTTLKQSDATLKYIREEARKLCRPKDDKSSMLIEAKSKYWMAQTETPRLKEIIHHLSPRLAEFISVYQTRAEEIHMENNFRPTKVAIIDNGILSMSLQNSKKDSNRQINPDKNSDSSSDNVSSSDRHLRSQDFLTTDSLWARVCEGQSFVHEQDRMSPWYLASNPHGTQMANLVCAIDPLCQLFVAKIADHQYGYSAAHAEEAVRWAIDKDVDIISMSFTTTENHVGFNEAVREAMNKGILVVCSHHDEGAGNSATVYPISIGGIDSDSMIRMAGCNRYGKLETESVGKDNEKKYDFCINSEDVTVGAIPFLDGSTEHISGSSVATAIAAGVCSLLIACLHTLLESKPDAGTNRNHADMVQNVKLGLRRGQNDDKYSRPSGAQIKAFLKTMAPKNNSHFVSLERFASLHELRDVNTLSVSELFFKLGADFGRK